MLEVTLAPIVVLRLAAYVLSNVYPEIKFRKLVV
jgi:hypothetical protein